MTWLYVPSVSATDTQALSSDCDNTGYEPWLVLSGTATRRRFSWPGWKNRLWIKLLFGTISQPLMAQRGVDAWISSLRDSRVSRSPLPVNVKVLTMTGGSGLPSDGSSVTWDRDTCSWRTSPDLFGPGSLTSLPILPTSGSMRNGVCSPRPTLVPLTDGNDSGYSLWPGVTAMDSMGSGRTHRGADGYERMTLTDRAVRMWTTPTADDTSVRRSRYAQGGTALSMQAVAMWPTPCARDGKGEPGPNAQMDTLPAAVSRHVPTPPRNGNDGSPRADLNPQFVAALMGVPWDWLTHSTSEATDSSLRVLVKHSDNSSRGSADG